MFEYIVSGVFFLFVSLFVDTDVVIDLDILRHTDGSFVVKRSLMFNSIQVLFTVQEVGASDGTEATRVHLPTPSPSDY